MLLHCSKSLAFYYTLAWDSPHLERYANELVRLVPKPYLESLQAKP